MQDVRSGQGKFTNPLLECDQAQGEFSELTPFQDKISLLANNLKAQPEINDVSVYFRDLNNGPWFGVNEQATYAPASLLKVPLAIAYYKLSESQDEGILQKSIIYKGPDSSWPPITQTVVPAETLVVGQSYTNEQLIERMLEYSDNVSYYLLFENIDVNFLLKVYGDFGLEINGPGTADDSAVSIKDYSTFFRILYNASYLNEQDSEKLLSLLSASEFKDGIVAGVPTGVVVSHKFGERESTKDNVIQLSDCGIVYYPQHPYALCISTKGTDLTAQAGAIKNLSAEIYNEVDDQHSDSSRN